MVFALLIAAILWNLGTWYLGFRPPASHTLIGSIVVSAMPTPSCRSIRRQRRRLGTGR